MWAALVRVVAAGALFAACDAASATKGGPRYFGRTVPRHGPDEVWTNLSVEPEWIDPGKCADHPGGIVIANVFAGLTQPHPESLQPMPDVAESWEVSDDGRVYTFHLRSTTWSDGVPVTAHDFEYAWKRVLARETASRYASLLYPLKNAEAFNHGAVAADALGVHAAGDRILRVELEEPLPYFLDLTSYQTLMPVPRHAIERLAAKGLNPDLWTRPEFIVSNGAFTLAEWHFRQFMLLRKNPRYWNAASVRLRQVRLAMVENSNTVLNLYEAAEFDDLGSESSLPFEFMDHLHGYSDFQRSEELSVYFYWINVTRPPLDDVRVRRALSLSIDRAALVRFVMRGGQTPTADLVPAGLAGYTGLKRPLFDPVAAKRLLSEAGYGPGHPFPPVCLRYNTLDQHRQLAEAIQQMWKKYLGVEICIENQEWKVFLASLEANDFQIARFGWIGDYPDPNTFLELLTSTSGNNHSQWSDPRYDALLHRANRTGDRAARLTLLQEAERLAMDAAPMLPIYVYTRSELVKPYMIGHFSNAQRRVLMKYWAIDPRWYDATPSVQP